MANSQSSDSENKVLDVARRLIKGTDKHKFDPFERVTYQAELNRDRWQFPEQLVSLYHHPVYATLDDETRWNLSLQEALHFFTFNVHGEQSLVAEMAPRLYRNKRVGEDPVGSRYLQRFIHEENAHTYMIAGYCNRYGEGVGRNRNLSVSSPGLSAEGEDAVYYGRIWILENYLGFANRIAFDDPDLDFTAQEIHRYHHNDEARHKAWDKAMLEENIQRIQRRGSGHHETQESGRELATISGLLVSYIDYVCKAAVDPGVYRRVGLEDGNRLRQEVMSSEQRRKLQDDWTAPVFSLMNDLGLIS